MAGPINVEVRLRKGESVDRLIKRFTKKVRKEEILDEYRERKYFEKPSVKRRKEKAKRKRIAQQTQRERDARIDNKIKRK
jgi:small subunit ribosomal protein S21